MLYQIIFNGKSAVKFSKINGVTQEHRKGQKGKPFAGWLMELLSGDIADARDDKELLKSLLTTRSSWQTAGKHRNSIFPLAIGKRAAVTQQLRSFPAAVTKK